jgi:ABC-type transport system involved in multi-copper enzyme maturation permease subunit
MQFWAIIVDSFRESRDRKIFWVMLIISLFVAAAMACFSFEPGKVSILFGVWEIETDLYTTMGRLRGDLIATIVVDFVLDVVFGMFGIILAIVATAGFFPAFMAGGSIDIVLSKPMSRPALFLAKYIGGLVFILFHACVFVVVTFLVVGFRWHVWLPGYLLTIPLMALLFSYLYAISVLVAVYFRSTVAAVMVTLGAWFVIAGVQSADDTLKQFPSWQEYGTVNAALRTARWILPNTMDITYLAKHWSGAAVGTELFMQPQDEDDREFVRGAERIEQERMQISPFLTIGSSLLFEAVVLAMAMWRFARRDY